MIIFLLLGIPGIVVLFRFVSYFLNDRGFIERAQFGFLEVFCLLLLPALFVSLMDLGLSNNCCDETAVFSPKHRLSVYILIILSLMAYFYSSYRHQIASPVIELLTNCFLLIGIVLNVLIAIQVKDPLLWMIGNVPIILLFILMIVRNHHMFLAYFQRVPMIQSRNWEMLAWRLLTLPIFLRMPILLLLCLPILVVLSATLLLFGQKPDALISAFTQTYRQGLSQINSQCEGVVCDGHYLCTIAAKGHATVVKPERLGIRAGNTIICNRQLLVSNAFEELIADKAPLLHKSIRRNYNRIGSSIHRYYYLFNHKWISNGIYFLMKPLEWLFLAILYCCDRNPENRIARQYLSESEQKLLKSIGE